MRKFETGATRDNDENKLDFEGFFSPIVLERFAEYMHKHRKQADGEMRESDNWQKGMPIDAYMKSMWRHFFAVWKHHRAGEDNIEDLCALMFNVQGMLYEKLKDGTNDVGNAVMNDLNLELLRLRSENHQLHKEKLEKQ